MPEIDWIYRFVANDRFPEPLEEVAAIAAICEEQGAAYLLLGNRQYPPMCGAESGQCVGICTSAGDRLILEAVATICEKPEVCDTTPDSVVGLYDTLTGRMFCKIENVKLAGSTPLDASIMPIEDQATLLDGQATVKQLTKPERVKRVRAVSDFDVNMLDSVEIHLRIPTDINEVVIGLDPTAASWESQMTVGKKKMPSFAIMIRDGKLALPSKPLCKHLTNSEFWNRATDLRASLACIDGPCDTNGPKLLEDCSGWAACSDHGKRDAETQLTQQGVKLFWTTKNTVEKFEGASRWIGRSIRLFSDCETMPKIETHPHGVFTFLWQAFGQEGGPPPKSKPAGMDARLAILKKFLPELTRDMVPNHDALDAAAAALVAALHRLGRTKSFGSDENGGLIWMPNINECVQRKGTA